MSKSNYGLGQLTDEEKYWLDQLSSEINMSSFVTCNPTYSERINQDFRYIFPEEISSKIISMSNRSEHGVLIILLSGIQYLLSIYTGQKDVAIGVPAIKSKSGVAFQDHNLIIRNKFREKMSFKEFLLEVKQKISEANKHQRVSQDQLAKLLGLDSSSDELKPRTIVLLENIQENNSDHHRYADTIFRFRLSGEQIECCISYKADAMGNLVEKITEQLTHFYSSVISNPRILLSEIDILSEDRNRILFEFNQTASDYPQEKSVVELFESQVERVPDHIAVVYQDQQLTYKELNAKANHIAKTLVDHGIKENSVVGVMVERSLEMPIGFLGVLKSGGAYLPIDPNYPEDRIKYLLRSSKAKVLLKCSHLHSDFSYPGIEIMDIDTILNEGISGETVNLGLKYDPEGLMYILYTSGTTGEPKGVMVKRHSFVNLLNWYTTEFNIKETDHVMLIAPISFDTAHKNVFAPLIKGGRLYLYTAGRYDYNEMSDAIELNEIHLINCTPSGFYPLVDYNKNTDFRKLMTLKQVIVGGESMNLKKLKPWVESPNFRSEIVNTYGPTECTDLVSFYRIHPQEMKQLKTVPIGKPLNNTQIYIVDKDMNPVPIGVAGELCIGGVGLSHGYFNAPDLTEAKFVECELPGKKVYKTGDLAKWMPDGNIEFIGRKDHQTKIRGYRVELEEIETLLLKHDDIEEAVVIAMNDSDGSMILSAYFVSHVKLKNSQLRGFLSKILPDFMIPAYFTQLEKMPLSHNGKIDRKALPVPDLETSTSSDYIAPENQIEQQIAEIWEEVLGFKKIGVYDNFFELGGHSLKVAAIVLKMNLELQVDLLLSDVFRNPTIKELALYVMEKQKHETSLIFPSEDQKYYPVSSQQKRLFILWQFDRNSVAYNLPSATMIEGSLDQQKLIETFKQLVDRHESLRTSFAFVDDQLVQRVHQNIEYTVDFIEAKEDELMKTLNSFIKPFDLESSPLFRIKVIKYGADRHLLFTDFHHIIFDGTSIDIIMKEFSDLYSGTTLPNPSLQYRDYAVWQTKWFETDDFKKKESYWLDRFKDDIPVLNINTDYPRRSVQQFEGNCLSVTVDQDLKSRLEAIAVENRTTLYTVLLAALNVLMSKYTGQEDILIGSPTVGRTRPGLEQMIGMFANTVVMRNFPCNDKTFCEFLDEVKENTLKALDYDEYPFEVLVDQLGIQRNTGRNPLFDIMFSLESEENTWVNTDELSFHRFPLESNVTQFDIAIDAFVKEKTIDLTFKYSTQLFAEETIKRMADHFLRLLSEVVRDSDLPLQAIRILSEREEQTMLVNFNRTQTDYPSHLTLQELFMQKVKETPFEIAIEFEDNKLTYSELDAKSNQLARFLRKKNVGRGDLVGIVTEPSLEMIIGVLGVLKAGGAYFPIDPNFPISRVEYMLEDSQCSLILAQQHLKERYIFEQEVISLDDETIYNEDDLELKNLNQPDDLAYVIYTSGTTGTPKGVMIEHRNIVNQMVGLIETLDFDQEDRHLLLAKFTFDVSVQHMLLPILSGGKLFIPGGDLVKEPKKLWNFIVQNQIGVLGTVPTHMRVLLNHLDKSHQLRYVLLAGEVFTKNLYNELQRVANIEKIVNLYGPTETTIYTTYHICDGNEKSTIPIGKPLNNYKVYILDQHLRPVPVGVTGELCVSGAGVGRGYLNKPNLTNEQFVPVTFLEGERMYKTGDLARWLPDGSIEYIGRLDYQVKIKGVRVELDEIKNIILSHGNVMDATVVAKQSESNENYLCAYIVSEKDLTVTELRAFLENHLPEYMIPSYFVKLESMPLTASGKMDIKALQTRNEEHYLLPGSEYSAPTTPLEKNIAEIWKHVLGMGRVGIHDRFFELGGNSLNIIQVNERLKEELNIDLPVVELFKHPTIYSLTQQLKVKEDKTELTKAVSDRNQVMEESKRRLKQRRQRKRD
ncbi:non-ribosomal peptide synthetase [Hazenella coriacea]|uniref:Amino acid adenylation domain-containing protein n=1 Tax=Hazenella coriacea TaxID=1179467 RepID=A0A4R3LCL1_9BACL|nr:non-ribosomal peptide synthetase [Hazenella coriacea]TCS97015.1 amino acid adenylation domain-containing protein [Hazenella coriacea]